MVAVAAEGLTNYAPCPRVVLTISGLGESQSVVSVWRIADGGRASVNGARRIPLTDAAFITDYYAPFGRNITYEVEVLSGPTGASRTLSNVVRIDAAEACLMDPLMPGSAVPVRRRMSRSGDPVFMVTAMREVEYQAKVQQFEVMGSDRPLSLYGQRSAGQGINISLVTDGAEHNARVRSLFKQSAQILVRVPKSVTDVLEGSCFLSVESVTEESRKAHTGRDLTTWNISGDVSAAPTIKPLTGGITFGDVAMFYATFQAKHDSVVAAAAAAGEQPTFLFDLMNPLG